MEGKELEEWEVKRKEEKRKEQEKAEIERKKEMEENEDEDEGAVRNVAERERERERRAFCGCERVRGRRRRRKRGREREREIDCFQTWRLPLPSPPSSSARTTSWFPTMIPIRTLAPFGILSSLLSLSTQVYRLPPFLPPVTDFATSSYPMFPYVEKLVTWDEFGQTIQGEEVR